MEPIRDFINRIKWNPKENPQEYSFFYLDRLSNELKKFTFSQIKKIENEFLILKTDQGDIHLPLHRIKLIKKKGLNVWRRNF